MNNTNKRKNLKSVSPIKPTINMSKNRLSLITLLVAAFAFLASCDDEKEQTLSADQTKDAFNAVETELIAELENLSEAEGFQAFEHLSSLSGSGDPFPLGRTKEARKNPNSYVRKAVANLQNMISGPAQGARTQGDEPFSFAQHKGVYEWNAVEEMFIKTGQSNIIEIKFPATETSTTNNAVFRLTDYAEVATPDGDEAYSATIIEATLDIDGTKEASLSVDVEYVGDGTDEPKFADISYFVNPYTIDIDLDDRGASTTIFSQYLSKGNKKLIGWGLTATYQGAKSEANITKLVGTFQLSTIIFTIEVNAPSGLPAEETDFNDIIKISITVDGASAGRIVWVTDPATGEPTPYVQYADGSQEPLSEVFETLGEALNDLAEIG